METRIWKKSWRLVGALILSWGFFLSPQASGATPKTYVDPHGFFSFSPPAGWVEKDFPGATVGRVRFNAPERQATLSIIVMPARPQEATFEKLLAEKRLILEKMRKEKPEGKYHLSESTICQFKCVKFKVEFPGQIVQENYLFVDRGLSVSFGYAAKIQANLDKYRSTALDSFCTIKLKGKK